MKFSRHTLKLIRNAAAGPGLAASAALGAPLIYDLRFADGQHTKMPMAGDLLTVELWERVTGTNATVTDEKLGGGYAVIISEQIDGGYMLNGGFTSGSRVAPFAGSG